MLKRKPKFKAICFDRRNHQVELFTRTDSFEHMQAIIRRKGLRPKLIVKVSQY